MYKQKLQELCHQRQWAPPNYASAKDGPDHNPRFWASVSVNGATFDGPKDAPSRTSKEAQNEAARVAFHHFVPSPASPAPMVSETAPPQSLARASCSSSAETEVDEDRSRTDGLKDYGSDLNALTMDAREMQYLYKIQLQTYAQKRNLNLPTYEHVREGSIYASRFKALVTINGQVFESPQFFSTLRDAEHAAAKVALMSLSAVGNQEEEQGFYKNLLQELTQKEGLTMPIYNTVADGPPHMPTFISTVEIEGETFQGSAAKAKRHAETNAARVAWTRLRERKMSRLPGGFLSGFQILDINDASSSFPSMDTQLPKACQPPVLFTKPDHRSASKDAPVDHFTSSPPVDDGDHVTGQVGGTGKGNSTTCLQKPNSADNRGQSSSYARLRDPFPEESMSSDDEIEISSVSPASECLDHSLTNSASARRAGSGDSSLLCNRVCVFPHRPDLQLPSGTKLLPFSDEMWVAVSVEPSSEGSPPA